MAYVVFFFFSSRRRHTRLQGDWSSDVCSSDLPDDQVTPLTQRCGQDVAAAARLVVGAEGDGPVDRGGEVKVRLFTNTRAGNTRVVARADPLGLHRDSRVARAVSLVALGADHADREPGPWYR